MSTQNKLIQELKAAMVGWTVTDVVTHNAYEAPLAEFVLQKGDKKRRVQVCAGDLGGWIRAVKDSVRNGPFVHQGEGAVEKVLVDITTHLMCLDLTFIPDHDPVPDPYPLIASADPLTLTIVFRCPPTGDSWFIHTRSTKKHRLIELFQTPAGRKEIARRLVEDGGYPYAFPELRDEPSWFDNDPDIKERQSRWRQDGLT